MGPAIKRDGGNVSLSSDSTHSKVRKLDEENITSGAVDRKNKDDGKKATRKHLHVRVYRKFFIKGARKNGSQGITDERITEKNPLREVLIDLRENTTQEVNDGKGQVRKEDDLQDDRELCVETIEPLKKNESRSTKLFSLALDASSLRKTINQEHQTKCSGSKCEIFIPNLKSVNSLESSEEGMHDHDLYSKNMDSSSSILECWRTASMLRHKLDRNKFLAIAKDKSKCDCTELVACSIYSKLKILKEKYPCQLESLRVQCIQNSQSPLSETADIGRPIHGRAKETASFDNSASGVDSGFPFGSLNDHYLINEVPGKSQNHIEPLKDDLFKSQIDLVEQVFFRRSEDLVQRQQAEVANFKKQMHDDRRKLERAHHFDLDIICAIHVDSTVRYGKVDFLTQVFFTKLGGFDQHVKQQKEKLLSMQLHIMNKEKELNHSWLQLAKTTKMDESFDDLPRLEISFRLERFSEYVGTNNSEASTYACSSNEEHTVSQGCLQVSSVTLNGQEEIDKIGDEVISTSLMVDSVEQLKLNGACIEPSNLPELTGVHLGISAPQAGVNTFKTRLTGSVIEVFNIEQLEDRDGSSGPYLIPNPELIPGELVSTSKVLETSVPSSSFSSIQAEFPVQDALEPAVVETELSVQQIPEVTCHPIRPQDDPPLERTSSEHLEGAEIQQDQLNQLFQNLLSIEWVPLQEIYADPMQNELLRIQKQDSAFSKKHENKKIQLQLECDQEFEEVKRKYDALLQDAERDYLSDKMMVERIYHKVSWHKIFAEELGTNFFNRMDGLSTTLRAHSRNSSQQHQASPSEPRHPDPPSTSAMSLAPASPSIPSVRPRLPALPTRSMSQTSPSALLTQPLCGPSAPRPTIQVGRSPAPHLQCSRSHASLPRATAGPPASIGMTAAYANPTFGFSQPSTSQMSPLHFRAPLLELPHIGEPDDLLESLLANFPANAKNDFQGWYQISFVALLYIFFADSPHIFWER